MEHFVNFLPRGNYKLDTNFQVKVIGKSKKKKSQGADFNLFTQLDGLVNELKTVCICLRNIYYLKKIFINFIEFYYDFERKY